jgi:hypothetical protein
VVGCSDCGVRPRRDHHHQRPLLPTQRPHARGHRPPLNTDTTRRTTSDKIRCPFTTLQAAGAYYADADPTGQRDPVGVPRRLACPGRSPVTSCTATSTVAPLSPLRSGLRLFVQLDASTQSSSRPSPRSGLRLCRLAGGELARMAGQEAAQP